MYVLRICSSCIVESHYITAMTVAAVLVLNHDDDVKVATIYNLSIYLYTTTPPIGPSISTLGHKKKSEG